MPDGVALATDILRPQVSTPVPALLVRTPYGKDVVGSVDPADVLGLVTAGYAVVSQDTRGRFDSEGDFTPFRAEPADGAATIAWAGAQDWCTGRVGMLGGSYVGATQWLAAGTTPPALGAFAPYVTASEYHEGWVYQGGAFQLGFCLRWALGSLSLAHFGSRHDVSAAGRDGVRRAYANLPESYQHRPLPGFPALDEAAPYYREWLEHPLRDEWWAAVAPNERYEAVSAPALNIGGWYDIFIGGTVENYRGLRARGGSAAARTGTRLLVGPWSHTNTTRYYPERFYSWEADLGETDVTGLYVRFFDRWLKDVDNGIDHEPPVRLFVMGVDRWQDEVDWPPPDANEAAWFLHSGGRANSSRGDGTLSRTAPEDEPEDTYRSDPLDPVPSMGGATLSRGGLAGWNDGPWDQAIPEARADVLSYTSEPLERPLGVIGSIALELHAASSARDTDFVARLVDVHPNGRAEIITEGILRARYRESLASPRALEPGVVEQYRIELGPTANVFLRGHRIRLDVCSSSFPRFDPNTQTGNTASDDGPADVVVATNRVVHDRGHPSRLLLPVVDRPWED